VDTPTIGVRSGAVNLLSPTPFTGGLYTHRQGLAQKSHELFSKVHGITIESNEDGGWIHLQLASATPLTREKIQVIPEYQYDFLFRSGQFSRFLLVSTHADLVDALLEKLRMNRSVYRPDIEVSRLVNDLTKEPGKYSIGAVYARIEGQGQALRTTSFFGYDLGESALFRKLLPEIVPYRVTLRDVIKRVETVSIGSKGEVGFTYTGQTSMHDADAALRFLSSRGYLKWEVEEEERQ
jgi:hypothetical protein